MNVNDAKDLLLARLFMVLPLNWVDRIGTFLGERHARRGIRANRKWAQRMHNHFERLWGIQDAAERERFIIEHQGCMGRVLAQIPVLHRLVRANRLTISGAEHFAKLKGPVLIVTAHLSQWELIGRVAELIGGQFCDIYVPQTGAREQITQKVRMGWRLAEGKPGKLIPAGPHTMREVARAIYEGSNLILFIDEEAEGEVRAPRLGREPLYAGNRWFAARLAIKHQMTVLPVHFETTEQGDYRAVIESPLPLPREGSPAERTRHFADMLDQKLEQWVMHAPNDWYWLPLLELNHAKKKS
ncbi:lysophospholipid acyltransferase family protein [Halothiobacillus neapolitanus]|uniref:Lipid A biosynthesis acyltransferase n=1 Tax=Halothiobacillus neapolitanus (strain ATCC 23641 / DSM 15147 / CIP 104769 / NCIMB 8539 / c2) TaxID=555778 RepID=D0L0U0_HALNC|nr:lipid A biosynthesis acyltransferase [Halothiobacillus neapolitanus]ACX96313.1 lipid A biosynthesis acyltransferase [Halothiobacillus neapolitanus c2]TDN66625.1 lauroyl/myristoyl acyltransferase [Halothiobacillus neapolitanus]